MKTGMTGWGFNTPLNAPKDKIKGTDKQMHLFTVIDFVYLLNELFRFPHTYLCI